MTKKTTRLNFIKRGLKAGIYALIIVSSTAYTSSKAEDRNITLSPIIDLIFTSAASSKITLFSDSLDTDDGWVFETSGVSTSDDEFDTATAQIEDGILQVSASQEYGCPSASAEKLFIQDDSVTNVTMEIVVPSTFISDSGSARIRLRYNQIRVVVNLDNLTNQENGFDIENGVLKVTFRDGLVKGRLDDINIPSDALRLQILEPNDQASIRISASACGSDGFHDGRVEIDAIDLFTF